VDSHLVPNPEVDVPWYAQAPASSTGTAIQARGDLDIAFILIEPNDGLAATAVENHQIFNFVWLQVWIDVTCSVSIREPLTHCALTFGEAGA
jgi:hypothetical protein